MRLNLGYILLTSAMRHQNSYLPLKPLITPVPPYGSTFKYAIFLRHPNHLSQNHKTPCLSVFQKVGTSRNVKTAEVRIIREAVLCNATIIAVCHNHPSGSIMPSRADDALTQQIKRACEVMRLHFMDHVIITDGQYFSYHETGKL